MTNKLTLMALIALTVASCGKEVSIPNYLEKHSSITHADSLKVKKVGMLKRGDQDTLEIEEKFYKISKFSSQQALSFVAALPKGSAVAVKFRGELKTDEVILEMIE